MAANDYEQRDKNSKKINHYASIFVALPVTEDEVTLSFVDVPPKLAKIEASKVELKYCWTDDGEGENPNKEDDQDDFAGRKDASSRQQLTSMVCPRCSPDKTDRPCESNRSHCEDVRIAEKVSKSSAV